MKLATILFSILGLLIIINGMFIFVILALAKDINYIQNKVSNTVIINNTIIKKSVAIPGSHYPQEWIYNYTQGRFYGISMQPSIFENNWILTKDVNITYNIKQGDIIRYDTYATSECDAELSIYYKNDRYIIHRVIFVNNNGSVFVKGDNNEHGEYIKRCQIKSVVVGVLFT